MNLYHNICSGSSLDLKKEMNKVKAREKVFVWTNAIKPQLFLWYVDCKLCILKTFIKIVILLICWNSGTWGEEFRTNFSEISAGILFMA